MVEDGIAGGGTVMTIRLSKGRVPQRQVIGVSGLGKARWDVFLATLADTCNVRLSVATAGVSPCQAYRRRRRDQVFAAEWRAALTMGYERLEEELLRITLDALTRIGDGTGVGEDTGDAEGAGADPGASAAMRPYTGLPRKAGGSPDMQMALALLNRHRATVQGGGKPAMRGVRATPEETDAALHKLLDGLAKRLGSLPA